MADPLEPVPGIMENPPPATAPAALAVFNVSMPRCATCLHWDRFSGSNEGECFRIVAGGSAPMLATKYSAALVTPPDFGCTEHTPRLAEEKNP